MKKQNLILGFVVLSLSFLVQTKVLVAEEPEPGVARISLIHGDVSTMRGDSGDWVATTLNAPVVGGDKVPLALAHARKLSSIMPTFCVSTSGRKPKLPTSLAPAFRFSLPRGLSPTQSSKETRLI